MHKRKQDATFNISEPHYSPTSPVWTDKQVSRWLKNGRVIFSIAGREKRCSKCAEYWPADTEFFHPSSLNTDGLNYWCKACYTEWVCKDKAKKKRGAPELTVVSVASPMFDKPGKVHKFPQNVAN